MTTSWRKLEAIGAGLVILWAILTFTGHGAMISPLLLIGLTIFVVDRFRS